MGFPGGSASKESTCNVGDLGSIPELGRSHGEGNDYPLQYSGLENSTDHIVHGVAKSRTRLSSMHSVTIIGLNCVDSHVFARSVLTVRPQGCFSGGLGCLRLLYWQVLRRQVEVTVLKFLPVDLFMTVVLPGQFGWICPSLRLLAGRLVLETLTIA